jgi:hypothetical protein
MNELDTNLYSRILEGLYMGGTADEDTVFETTRPQRASITKKDFDTVITAYAWANPCDWGVKEVRYCFYDGDMTDVDLEKLNSVVETAYKDWKSGSRILVRCQLGANRSGLIVAKILMKDGYTADEAIKLVRLKRGQLSLSNKNFEVYLEHLAADILHNPLKHLMV